MEPQDRQDISENIVSPAVEANLTPRGALSFAVDALSMSASDKGFILGFKRELRFWSAPFRYVFNKLHKTEN